MKCSRCSAEIPAQSQFCLRCGTPLRGAAPTPGVSPALPPSVVAARANNRPLLAAIGVLLLLVVGLAGFAVKSLLAQKSGQGAGGQLVQAPGQGSTGGLVQAPGSGNPNGLVQAPGDSAPSNVTQAPGETAPNPADIDDYLKFLKRIEASKQQLIHKQTGDALMMLTQVKALSASIDENDYNQTFTKMNKGMAYSAGDWENLTNLFNSKQPPASCVDLRNKYYDQLGKVQAMIVAVNDFLGKVQSDPSSALHGLTDLQGRASTEIDDAVNKANDALTDVCDKYKLKKDFDIKGEGGSSGLLGG